MATDPNKAEVTEVPQEVVPETTAATAENKAPAKAATKATPKKAATKAAKEEKKGMSAKEAQEVLNRYANLAITKEPADLKEARKVLEASK